MLRSFIRLAVPVFALVALPASANYSVLSGTGFTYCHYGTLNTAGQTCADSEFSMSGSCSAACTVPGNYGFVNGATPWEIDGEANSIEGDAVSGTAATAQGERTGDVFTLELSCFYADDFTAPPSEIAVFRFDGDPTVFDGTSAASIADLVDLGLIRASDVLLVEPCPSNGEFSFDVDVSGIPDEALIVFAAGTALPGFLSGQPVPTISLVGGVTLALVFIGGIAWALRRSG